MPLWTDIIEPAELTGYARASLADWEEQQGSLARWLPNRETPDIVVRFVKGSTGLVEASDFRAFDAEPTVGARPGGQRVTLELPALGREFPLTEYDQLRGRAGNVSDAQALASIEATTRDAVRSAADAIEELRGIVLATGRATIDSGGFYSDDDFGRPVEHQLVAGDLWTDPAVSRLTYLERISDVYRASTGTDPGCILMGRRAFRALAAGDELQHQLINGGARRPSADEVRSTVSGAGLADIVQFDRLVRRGGVTKRALPDHTVLLLPEPVETSSWESTDLGATFWGRTLTSTSTDYGIEDTEQPGLVVGVHRNERPPMLAQVITDGIALPVLANAVRSLAARVLPVS